MFFSLFVPLGAQATTKYRIFDWGSRGIIDSTGQIDLRTDEICAVGFPYHGWPPDHIYMHRLFDNLTAAGQPVSAMFEDDCGPGTAPSAGTWRQDAMSKVLSYVTRLDYCFADFESSDGIADNNTFTMVQVIRSNPNPNISNAWIGNYSYFPGTPDFSQQYNTSGDRSDRDLAYRNSGLNIAQPSCYPYAFYVVHITSYIWGTNVCPNRRSALFWAPLEKVSVAKRALPPGHLLIPWTGGYVQWNGYDAWDDANGDGWGDRTIWPPTKEQLLAGIPTDEDLRAYIKHIRLRGADGFYNLCYACDAAHYDNLSIYYQPETYPNEAAYTSDMLAAWKSLDAFFAQSGSTVILNLTTSKTTGLNWSGVQKGKAIKVLVSNLGNTSQRVQFPADRPRGMPQYSDYVAAGTHVIFDYTVPDAIWRGGNTGASWDVPGNWDGNALPTISDNVYFGDSAGGTSATIDTGDNATSGWLTLGAASGATATLGITGGMLTVNKLTLGANGGVGNVNLGNAAGTGSIVNGSGGPADLEIRKGSIASVFRGYGTVGLTGTLHNDGKLIADGFGTERTLDLSTMTGAANDDNNTSDNGYYAVNKGKLVFPPVAMAADNGTRVYYFGESSAPDMINSVQMSIYKVSTPGTITAALLSLDRSDLPAPPSGYVFIGVWNISRLSGSLTSDNIAFRYDPTAIPAGRTERDLRVYYTSGSSWSLKSTTLDPANYRITVTNNYQFGYFAIVCLTPPPVYSLGGTVSLGDFSGSMAGIPATVQLKQAGSVVRTDNVTLDGAGQFTLASVTSGTYDVRVKPSHWLARTRTSVAVTGNMVISPAFSVINGDGNGDNQINSSDLSSVLTNLDAAGSPADLDGDGAVTGTDLAIVLANMDLQGDQ